MYSMYVSGPRMYVCISGLEYNHARHPVAPTHAYNAIHPARAGDAPYEAYARAPIDKFTTALYRAACSPTLHGQPSVGARRAEIPTIMRA